MNDKLSNNAHSVRQMYLHGNTHLRYLGLLACDCQSYRVRKFERRFYSYRVTLYSVPERKNKRKKYVQSSTYSSKGGDTNTGQQIKRIIRALFRHIRSIIYTTCRPSNDALLLYFFPKIIPVPAAKATSTDEFRHWPLIPSNPWMLSRSL